MLVGAEAAVPKLALAARWPPVVFKFVHIVDCSVVLLVLTNNVYYKKGSEEYTVEFGTRLDADAGALILVRTSVSALCSLAITTAGWSCRSKVPLNPTPSTSSSTVSAAFLCVVSPVEMERPGRC